MNTFEYFLQHFGLLKSLDGRIPKSKFQIARDNKSDYTQQVRRGEAVRFAIIPHPTNDAKFQAV